MALSFAQALREFNSTNTKARVEAAKRLLKDAGEPGAVSPVIAHDPEGGYRPGVMAALGIPDPYAREAAQYLGAWHGALTQQPRVVAFHTGDGADRLHTIRASVQPEQLANALRNSGVTHFALRTSPAGSSAYVYDQGGTRDFTSLSASLPNGSATHVTGSGVRLGQGAGPDSRPVPAYRDAIRAVEARADSPADGGDPARLKLARKAGGPYQKELKPWVATIAAMPDDKLRRSVFADWLEEHGHEHSADDLHRLRTHEGPLFVTRHPTSGKVVAVPGHPIRTDTELDDWVRGHSVQSPYLFNLGTGEIVHGPHAVVRVVRDVSDEPSGSYMVQRFTHGSNHYHILPPEEFHSGHILNPESYRLSHPTRASAMQAAARAAFEQPTRLARLPAGAIRHRDMRTWEKVIAQMPEDRLRRGVFADWLEEKGMHHSEEDLARLRSHEGPLFVVRHPRTKKVVAVPGIPVRDAEDLDALRTRHGHMPVEEWLGAPAAHVVHGPRGIFAVVDNTNFLGQSTGHHGVAEFHPETGTYYHTHTFNDGHRAGDNPRPAAVALRHARRLAFGD